MVLQTVSFPVYGLHLDSCLWPLNSYPNHFPSKDTAETTDSVLWSK